jgi:NADP-dependent 3-hydroxy acid dehydrogenase YdfG
VRVIGIHPGRTATPMQAEVHRMEGKDYDPTAFVTAEDVAASVVHAVEMPRNAAITELSIRPGGA